MANITASYKRMNGNVDQILLMNLLLEGLRSKQNEDYREAIHLLGEYSRSTAEHNVQVSTNAVRQLKRILGGCNNACEILDIIYETASRLSMDTSILNAVDEINDAYYHTMMMCSLVAEV